MLHKFFIFALICDRDYEYRTYKVKERKRETINGGGGF